MKNNLTYCIYACQDKDYHYGTPKQILDSKDKSLLEVEKYKDGYDKIQIRVVKDSFTNIVETIQIK